MGRALLNGIELNYHRCPVSGPEVVLVHGLATSLAFWYFKVLPLLATDHTLTLYDLRGHGWSTMPPWGYTTADMAADLHALLDHLGISRVHLVGHSYGGAIALHYSVLHPERVSSLTLADTRVRCLQPTQRLEDWPDGEAFGRVLKQINAAAPLDHPEIAYLFLEVLAEAQVSGKAVQDLGANVALPFGWSAASPSDTARRWLQLLRTTTARHDIVASAGLTPENISRVRKPVLAIFGERSHCLPSLRGIQRCLPHCEAAIVPQAGHFHPTSRPLYFAHAVRRFLNTAGQEPARRVDA